MRVDEPNTFNRCHTPERNQTVRRQHATRPLNSFSVESMPRISGVIRMFCVVNITADITLDNTKHSGPTTVRGWAKTGAVGLY